MRRLLLAGAAILVLATSASAEDPSLGTADAPKACLDWPVALVAAQANHPDAALVKEMQGEMAQEFIDVVNKLPPASTFDGDHAALFFRPNDDQFLVLIGHGSCARHVVELPAAIFAQMVGQPV
jgi:hypothetical protein